MLYGLLLCASVIAVVSAASIRSTGHLAPRAHPALEHFVSAYTGGNNYNRAIGGVESPLTRYDVVRAFGYEANEDGIPYTLQYNSSALFEWYSQVGEGWLSLGAKPEQLHIAMTEVPTTISVSWTTNITSTGARVCWRQANSTTTTTSETCANGTSWTYSPVTDWPWVGMLHTADISGLVPGQHYEYRVFDPSLPASLSSDVVSFIAPTANKDTLFVALGGDMGSYQLFGHAIAKQIRNDEINHNLQFDAFWLIGDIAYSTLDPPKKNYEFFWDVYMRQEASFANHIPMHVSYGNHDFSGGDSAAFVNRFRMPQSFPGNANYYWAHRHGPIFYVSMCTEISLNPSECSYAPGTKQFAWLEATLGAINRTETPWLVLAGHRPMYSSDTATDSGPLQRYIEPLLRKYNVDIELAGHMHATEVVSPVFNNTAFKQGVSQTGPTSWNFNNPQAPVHLTVGNTGAIIHEKFVSPQPEWSLYRNGTIMDNAYGYTQLRATRTSLQFTCLRAADGSVMWEVVLDKTSV